MRRNPELSARKPSLLGKERAVLSSYKLDKWFRELHDYLETEHATSVLDTPSRIWNADESGFPLGPTSAKTLGPKNQHHRYQFGANTKQSLTTIVAGSASGVFVPPMIVYPGTRKPRTWMPLEGVPENWFHGYSKTGWMNAELFHLWLVNHFYPVVLSLDIHFPILLLVDGHSSHMAFSTGDFCREHGIILFRLQAHSSHITQPLDLSVFGPLKTYYKQANQRYLDTNPWGFITKAAFARVFMEAFDRMTPNHLRSGFRAAGIYPWTGAYNKAKVMPATILVDDEASTSTATTTNAVDQPSSSAATTSTGNGNANNVDSTSAVRDHSAIKG